MPISVAGAISTLHFDAKILRVDLPFLLVLSAVVLLFFAMKRGLQKYEAAIILGLYCGYALLRISNV